jgi:hypothetical protein
MQEVKQIIELVLVKVEVFRAMLLKLRNISNFRLIEVLKQVETIMELVFSSELDVVLTGQGPKNHSDWQLIREIHAVSFCMPLHWWNEVRHRILLRKRHDI